MYADELEAAVQIHLHETQREVAQAREQFGHGHVELLRDTGLLGPRLQTVHMTQLTAAEIEMVAAAKTSVVHCPASNMQLASGTCPVAELQAQDVTVALGTDGAASNNTQDLFAELRLAGLLAKHANADATQGQARDMLKMATLEALAPLAEQDIGSLEAGRA